MNFQHLIITRMNLGLYSRRANAEAWMKHRMGLFDRYLLPSVQKQTNQNFKFVLCFDERTPPEVVCRYDYLDNVVIAWESPMTWIKTITPEAQWLVTSRIDNDDYYLPEFVERVQAEVRQQDMLIDIDYYQQDGRKGKTGVFTSGRTSCTSPFMTLVERWDDPRGVYFKPHDMIYNFYPVRRKVTDILAVQICHEMCQLNRIRGTYLPNVIIKQ